MTDDKVTAFWLFVGLTRYSLKLWWQRTKKFYATAVRGPTMARRSARCLAFWWPMPCS